MKLATEREFCATSGTIRSSGFGIKASAKAFKILSAGLYSDRIKAVIREISTNAYDSHVVNGNSQEPFEVKLPTYLDANFYVRDFGTGLTKEELGVEKRWEIINGVSVEVNIPGVYNTYFESNKTDSNELNGCLGLGSKSPFAYTSNFVVESFKDGTHYICSVHHNEFGEPAITLMSEQPTTERNGIRVSMAVERNDVSSFHDRAIRVYKYFPVTPKFIGHQLNVAKAKVVCEGTDWKLLSGYEKATAVMGNVCYPIELSKTNDFTSDEMKILNCNFELHFNLGELEFDAGRESLGYDKKTVACIKARCRHVRDEISDHFKDVHKDCKNLWAARLNYVKLSQELSAIWSLLGNVNTFNGAEIFKNGFEQIHINVKDAETVKFVVPWNSKNSKAKKSESKDIQIKLNETITFVENDLERGAFSRVMRFIDDKSKVVVLASFNTPQAKLDFMELVGLDASDITFASSLPKSPSQARSASSGNKLEKICQYRGAYHTSTNCWEGVEKELEDGGVYVEINRGKMVINQHKLHSAELKDVVQSIKSLTNDETEVFGIKSILIKKVSNMNEWVSLKELVKALLTKHPEYEDMCIESSKRLETYSSHRYFIESLKKIKDINDDLITEVIGLYNQLSKQADKKAEEVNAFKKLYEFVNNCEYIVKKNVRTLDKICDEIIIKYPLLGNLSTTTDKTSLDHYSKYINMIAKENK